MLKLLVFQMFYFERFQTYKEVARLVQGTFIYFSPGLTILNDLPR